MEILRVGHYDNGRSKATGLPVTASARLAIFTVTVAAIDYRIVPDDSLSSADNEEWCLFRDFDLTSVSDSELFNQQLGATYWQ